MHFAADRPVNNRLHGNETGKSDTATFVEKLRTIPLPSLRYTAFTRASDPLLIVGSTVGPLDGITVGHKVGIKVGNGDGAMVGITVGFNEGRKLGVAVGFLVGIFVGATLGAIVGEFVCTVGVADGCALGTADG